MAYHNVYEFARSEFDVEPTSPPRSQGATLEIASKRLYKYSPRGLSLASLHLTGKHERNATEHEPIWGVQINGIVEGTDIEASQNLMFPFDCSAFWDAVDALNATLEEAELDWEAQA